MKIKFSRPIIQEAIGTALSCVSNKNTITAVEGVLITCEEDKVVLFSYDLEKGMRIEIEADIEEPGSCILNAQSLNSIIRLMPAGIIELSVNEYYRASLSCGDTVFELNAMNGAEFPTLPDIEGGQGLNIKQSDLKSMIAQTLFAVAQNDARASFNGAYFKVKGNRITAVGCDSFRLAIRDKVCEMENDSDSELDMSFIVPGKTLSELLKLLNDADENVNISVTRKQVIFHFEKRDVLFFSRLIEGEYIDYERIIPKNSSIFVDVDTAVFEGALNRASIVTDDSAGKNKSLARCHFFDNKLEITSASINGKVRDVIPTSHTGSEIEIGFNCRYLTDALKASMTDKLRLSLSSPYISMVIEPLDKDENDTFTFLVLPCKLK